MSTIEPTEQESFWKKTIDGWKSKAKQERTAWNKYSTMYRTMANPRGNNGSITTENSVSVETNWLFALADTMAANVVPTNPAVTIKANREKNDEQAKLRTQLANTLMARERMHQRLWQLVMRGTVFPRAWLKCVWNDGLGRPILRVINPHYVFFDIQAETEADMKYVIEVTVITKGEFNSRLKKQGKRGGYYRADAIEDGGVEFGNWPQWIEPEDSWTEDTGKDREAKLVRDNYEWAVIYEVYDLVSKTFYHFAEGTDRALMEAPLPYKHLKNPYKLLTFNDNLHDLGGMADAELLAPTIERINEMDTLQMAHLKTAIPSPVIHENLLDDPGSFLDAYLAVDGPGQPLSLHARPGVGIDQIIGVTPMPTLPIEWARARKDLEGIAQFISGMPSYQRGEVGNADVATELALTDTATRTRNARRQKAVYDVIEWTAAATVSLYQEFMDPEESIPVRVTDTENEAELTKELMGFGDDAQDPWAWDYQAHPYTAAEQNEVVQLKTMETYMPILLQGLESGIVDARKLYKKLLELLHMPEVLADKQAQQAAQAPAMDPAAQGMPGGAPLPAGPGGMSGMMPDAAQPSMQGGEVAVGAGAQSAAGGV